MEEYGFSAVTFITFKGNRFNIKLYNGGVLFSLYGKLKDFFFPEFMSGTKECLTIKVIIHKLHSLHYLRKQYNNVWKLYLKLLQKQSCMTI